MLVNFCMQPETETRIANKFDSYTNHDKGSQFCTVVLLDCSVVKILTSKHAKGSKIFDEVCRHLHLIEKDYFGLSYNKKKSDKKDWLVCSKGVAKQLKKNPWHFWFEVKFYPPEPSLLRDDLTRYYLCLQIHNDIISEKLPCTTGSAAVLGSYLIQSQFGDYDPKVHSTAESYLSDHSFAPNQNLDLLQEICRLHKLHKGKTPSEAEMLYLENAKKLAMYGVDLYEAKDVENTSIFLGVCSSGLLVYSGQIRLNRFAWPKILKISFKRNRFCLNFRPGELNQQETKVYFKLSSDKAAEKLWKVCAEHHTFFRLMTPENPPKRRFFHFGSSRFCYDGRTLYQTKLAAGLLDRNLFNWRRTLSGPLIGRPADKVHESKEPNEKAIKKPFGTLTTPPLLISLDQPDKAKTDIKPVPMPRKSVEMLLDEIYSKPRPLETRRNHNEDRSDSAIGLDPPGSEIGARNHNSSPEEIEAQFYGGDENNPAHQALRRIAMKRMQRYEHSAKRQRDEIQDEDEAYERLLSFTIPTSYDVVVIEGTPVSNGGSGVKPVENVLQRNAERSPLPCKTSTPTKLTLCTTPNVLQSTDDSTQEKSTVSMNLNPRNPSASPNDILTSGAESKLSPPMAPNCSATMNGHDKKAANRIRRKIDHDAELATAIMRATQVKSTLTVEKLEYNSA